MTDPQHEVAMLVRSIRSAADDLKALKPWLAQDDRYALDAAKHDITEVCGFAGASTEKVG